MDPKISFRALVRKRKVFGRTYPVPSDRQIPRTTSREAARSRARAAKRRGNLEIRYELLLPP